MPNLSVSIDVGMDPVMDRSEIMGSGDRRRAGEADCRDDIILPLEAGSELTSNHGGAIARFLDVPLGPEGPWILEFGDRRILLLGRDTTQSAMMISDPDHLLYDYTKVMMGFVLLYRAPGRIDMIGLGGGSLPKYCYRRLPSARIVVAEIDPAVIALRKRFAIPDDDERFQIECVDGAQFIGAGAEVADVLCVDGFDRDGQPSGLCSQDFYDQCYSRLTPQGILVVNLCDDPSRYAPIIRRIKRSFSNNVLVVRAEEQENRVIFAGKSLRVSALPKLLTDLETLDTFRDIDMEAIARRMWRGALVSSVFNPE
ncbi:spermidine synthase [Novosphingobium sp. SG751A]|uniref:fused MFS/spermidine synthase n=1 Tax=Novosphingobium sp. SG751A TaxID=2587000 RepID=UPI001557DC8D|nr:spermidine synthase [Novosphingobium sp. SG751A]